jgi:4-hydroxy-3-polyprenylbenzoate decarboxylase
MAYQSLQECVQDLEKHGHLIRIKEEVDPHLELAAIQLRVFQEEGKAVFFEKVKGSPFPAVSNLFGTLERSRFMFRDTLEEVKKLVALKADPMQALKNPFAHLTSGLAARMALPKKVSSHNFQEIQVSDLPQLHCWPMDGGAFITLPQVYTEDMDKPGVMNSNLGMYRVQLSGNDYVPNKEIGLHYQIHRGIGVHQAKATAQNKPLKVSVFIGGPPAHTLAAVMPLPEGMSELTFAGVMGGRRFRYVVEDGYTLSTDADFVLCGEIYPNEVKPEGPFGDHLGYYSLKHDFPVLRLHKVYAKKDAIWPFTVVGRPPQEDSQFGALIHEITDSIIPAEIPGIKAVNAVDEAGVHPLLLAIGSERYTPYNPERKPQELLTLSNHVLGKGQLSLAKYLLMVAHEDNPELDVNDKEALFKHLLERIDWQRDMHFQTETTMDTLDYSGCGINSGSKVVWVAAGEVKRSLATELPILDLPDGFEKAQLVMPGVLIVQGSGDLLVLINQLEKQDLKGVALITLVDDADFVAADFKNWLWVCFTRSNPSHDINGLGAATKNKHWGCDLPIIDARIKKHHAPSLEMPDAVWQRAGVLIKKYK